MSAVRDRTKTIAISLLLAGAVLRVVLAFPTGVFPKDADHLLTGLTSMSILEGDAVVFYAAERHGALESYLHIPLILLFGASRTVLAIAPLLASLLGLFAFWRLAVRIEGERDANLPLLFAVFAPVVLLFWTLLPQGYSETFTLGTMTLWLAAEAVQRPSVLRFAGLGLVAGLALWCSPLALAPVVAAGLYVLLHRRFRGALVASATLLLGAAPWIIYNVRWGFASLRSPYLGVQPAFRITVRKLVMTAIPGLFFDRERIDRLSPPPTVQTMLMWIAGLLMIIGLVIVARHARRYFLPIVSAVVTVLMFITSRAAAMTVVNGRYLLFATPLVMFALAAAVRRRRELALIWILAQGLGYQMPWSESRRERIATLSDERRLVQQLNGVRTVAGLYWDVYPIWFDSARATLPIAYPLDADYRHQRDVQPRAPWAAVLSPRSTPFARDALTNLGITGRITRVGAKELFLPDPRFASDATLPLRVADEAERLWRASL